MSIFWETRLGSLIAGAGIVWAAYIASLNPGQYGTLQHSDAVKVCGLGIILWLHGKWRDSTRAR